MSNPLKPSGKPAAMPLMAQALQARNESLFMAQKAAQVEANRLRSRGPAMFTLPKRPIFLLRIAFRLFPKLSRLWDRRMIVKSGLFDAEWYLARNPDVGAAGVDPARHFLSWGGADRRDPGPQFSSGAYLDLHPDVAATGVNPLVHFLKSGWSERRETRVAGEKR